MLDKFDNFKLNHKTNAKESLVPSIAKGHKMN